MIVIIQDESDTYKIVHLFYVIQYCCRDLLGKMVAKSEYRNVKIEVGLMLLRGMYHEVESLSTSAMFTALFYGFY